MDRPDRDAPGWFERPENISKLWYGLLAVCGALLVAELFYEHHAHFAVERLPGFYGLFGFVAFLAIVFAGKALRRLVMRDEDYYERD